MIESEKEYECSKEAANEYRAALDALLIDQKQNESDLFLDLQIASMEGQLLRVYEEIREYEARVLSR